jgi:hypothetical protein
MKTEVQINADNLYNFLKNNGSQWEYICLMFLFPPVIFSIENKKEYYEYLTRVYGYSHSYVINGIEYQTKQIPIKETYSAKLSEAYQYLKKQNKAGEKNNGYNEYIFYAK